MIETFKITKIGEVPLYVKLQRIYLQRERADLPKIPIVKFQQILLEIVVKTLKIPKFGRYRNIGAMLLWTCSDCFFFFFQGGRDISRTSIVKFHLIMVETFKIPKIGKYHFWVLYLQTCNEYFLQGKKQTFLQFSNSLVSFNLCQKNIENREISLYGGYSNKWAESNNFCKERTDLSRALFVKFQLIWLEI